MTPHLHAAHVSGCYRCNLSADEVKAHRRFVLEGFAGPGGASEGMRQLGIEAVGVEWDASACATRRTAGHRTIRADVASFPLEHLAGKVEGCWLSPPCPTFSSAGKGEGREDMPWLLSFLERVYRTGKWHDPWAWHQWSDPRTPLILEPVRWALTLNPEWMCCEQVPAGLPIWESIAAILEDHGFSCWAGVLNTADLGVPQTRQRAMLMASRVVTVHPPEPTHAREPVQSLFGPELLPWVSMAEALGWTADVEMVQRRGAGMVERHGERPGRPMDEPAFTPGAGTQRQKALRLRVGAQVNATERGVDEPAPTLTSSLDNGDTVWLVDRRTNSRGAGGSIVPTALVETPPAPAPALAQAEKWTIRVSDQFGDGSCNTPWYDPSERPSRVVTSFPQRVEWGDRFNGEPDDPEWPTRRPATTLSGDPRLAQPGHKGAPDEPGSKRQMDGCLKLTEAEGSILQGFPEDYPWQGTKSKRWEQIGNAVPPPLARACVAAVSLRGEGNPT